MVVDLYTGQSDDPGVITTAALCIEYPLARIEQTGEKGENAVCVVGYVDKLFTEGETDTTAMVAESHVSTGGKCFAAASAVKLSCVLFLVVCSFVLEHACMNAECMLHACACFKGGNPSDRCHLSSLFWLTARVLFLRRFIQPSAFLDSFLEPVASFRNV